MSPSVCRKAKTIFGLKVKKKKKKVNTDLVLANKRALGKACKTNTHIDTHTTAGCVCGCAAGWCSAVSRWPSLCQTVTWWRRSCRSSGPLWLQAGRLPSPRIVPVHRVTWLVSQLGGIRRNSWLIILIVMWKFSRLVPWGCKGCNTVFCHLGPPTFHASRAPYTQGPPWKRYLFPSIDWAQSPLVFKLVWVPKRPWLEDPDEKTVVVEGKYWR